MNHNWRKKCRQIKMDVLNASYLAGACHIGSALSCVRILVTLYYYNLRDKDIFVFSKASGVAALYAILADKGYFLKERLVDYLKNYPLASKEVPGVIHSVGSIAHGLNVACGIALGNRTKKVYCLISDGECQEGSTYEAALFARQHKLTNLYVIVDNNKYQACGAVKDILDLTTAFEFLKKTLPNFEVVETIKGEGVDFMEGKYEWHYKNLNRELLDKALKQI